MAVSSHKTVVYAGGYDVTTFLKTANTDINKDLEDVTTFSKTHKEFMPIMDGFSFSMGGVYDEAAGASEEILYELMNSTSSELVEVFHGGAATLGDVGYSGYAHCNGKPITSAISSAVMIDGTFQGDGKLYRSNVLAPKQTLAQNYVYSFYDFGSSFANGFRANLHVFAASADVNMTVRIRDSADGVTPGSFLTPLFSDLTTQGPQTQSATWSSTANRYLRVEVTRTAGSATFAVSLSRI